MFYFKIISKTINIWKKNKKGIQHVLPTEGIKQRKM